MTKQRMQRCPNPDCPHEKDYKMSDWIRKAVPDSSKGYNVQDIDFLIENYNTHKIMWLEIKTGMRFKLPRPQGLMFKMIERWIKKGIDDGYEYLGFHEICFENTFFDDGKVYWDGKEITEEELIKKLAI